ncbi:MAG: hypothetical protein CSA32_00400 [Desulfobulbus propionicus]|nr:MAG: hypothetical protein CSA32_00400 [Desulfobulbus propionicus]
MRQGTCSQLIHLRAVTNGRIKGLQLPGGLPKYGPDKSRYRRKASETRVVYTSCPVNAALSYPACLFQPLCSLALGHIALLCTPGQGCIRTGKIRRNILTFQR